MKAKFNEEKSTLKVNGKKFNVLSVKTELKGGDLKNGEWVNNKGYITFEIEEQPEAPERKFKAGDKVRIKDGISSKNYAPVGPHFADGMDEFIGMNLTVAGYTEGGYVFFNEEGMEYACDEDWIEPATELKKGDLAIFWDYYPRFARIAEFSKKEYGQYFDSAFMGWIHAVKFELTKEQKEFFNKVRKGEITL